MKTAFEWAWEGQAFRPDAYMTRDRLATLLRQWRRETWRGRPYYKVRLTERSASRRVYVVTTLAGEPRVSACVRLTRTED